MRQNAFAFAALALGLGLVACGTSESTFGDSPSPGDAPNGSPSGSAIGEIGPKGTGSACVREVASAELAPTNLVFIYDKSGSMGDVATGFDPAKRWIPVGTAMKEFFADGYSKTLRASLQFFPLNDDTIATTCAYPYAQPAVALRSASDAAFTQARWGPGVDQPSSCRLRPRPPGPPTRAARRCSGSRARRRSGSRPRTQARHR